MPPKVLKSMKAWADNTQSKGRTRSRAGVTWVKVPSPVPAREVKRVIPVSYLSGCSNEFPLDSRTWVVDIARTPSHGQAKAEYDPVASCEVICFDGDEAECVVKVSGYEMPRVSLPAWVLQAKGLKEKGRFFWTMRDDTRVTPADIDTEVPKGVLQLSDEKAKELKDLLADSRQREDEGEEWAEFTGSGK